MGLTDHELGGGHRKAVLRYMNRTEELLVQDRQPARDDKPSMAEGSIRSGCE